MSAISRITVTLLTQGALVGLSFITGIILPKYMGPESYGYWQIYYFYLAYINLLGLGFNDGVNLIYAGYSYFQLPMVKLRGSIRIINLYALCLTLIFIVIAFFWSDGPRQTIYIMLAINILPTILFCILTSIFLATNQSGIYNLANLMNKLVSSICFLVFIFVQITDFRPMIWADTATRMIVTGALCFVGANFFIGTSCGFKEGLTEIKTACSSGIKVMLTVVASGIIPMFGRIIIEWNEPIEVYGIYSFAVSLVGIILTFTNAVGLVLFPIIKRLSNPILTSYYRIFDNLYKYIAYIAFMVYIPIIILVKYFMVKYITVLDYMPVLIAMCLPLGKIQLLLFPYYKTLRLEAKLLRITLYSFCLMAIVNLIAYGIFISVASVAISSTIVVMLWYIGMELYLSNKIGYCKGVEYISELAMMVVFIFTANRTSNLLEFGLIYGVILLIVIILNRKAIMGSITQLRNTKH